jgi:D-beta-D-heptose 7-phosphate kinase/D-beta-D-heptose 1-phosphate adenosyltransferase
MDEIAPHGVAPLLDRHGLERFLEEVRRKGESLVFTNGCFDLLHAGHVAYLTQARALGDRLLIGLNSDASVGRLKGPGRPLVPEQERARVLGALRCVDGVVLFDEDTPRELILRVRPQILVKGGDYSPEQVVGAVEVRAWDGVVEILPYREGFSTSEMIRRIRNL